MEQKILDEICPVPEGSMKYEDGAISATIKWDEVSSTASFKHVGECLQWFAKKKSETTKGDSVSRTEAF